MSAQTALDFDAPALPVQHCPAPVLEAIHAALDYFRDHDLPFTAESVRDRLSFAVREILDARNEAGAPRYPNVMGGVIASLQRGRRITRHGFTEAQRDVARGRPLRIWRWVA